MISILFLASGGGGNMKFFDLAQKRGIISPLRLGVIADRQCLSLYYAKKHGLENELISYSPENPSQLKLAIEKFSPDIIVTNWFKILGADIVQEYQGKLINLHYSLLPAFSGMIGIKPIEAAFKQGCKFIGATCHLVDENIDTGYILSQSIFTTPNSIEDAISTMFRTGCLTLLDGIQQVTCASIVKNPPFIKNGMIMDEDFTIFNKDFWVELENL